MIPGVCPDCGAKFPLHAALADARARVALKAALEWPAPLASVLLDYLPLLAPKGRAITSGRLASLLEELVAEVATGEVLYNKVVRPAPQALWGDALREVAAHPPADLPLDGHAYLRKVAWSLAGRAAGRAEAAREAQLRSGARPGASAGVRGGAPQPAVRSAERTAIVRAALAVVRDAARGRPPEGGDGDDK